MSEKYQALRKCIDEGALPDSGVLMLLDATAVRDLLADHDRLQAQVEQLRTEAKVASDRIQELGRFTKAQRGEVEGLRADLSRTERNRDMWKEQCARQAEQLETGVLRLNAAQDDAQRYNAFFDAGLPITFLGQPYYTKADLDEAIDSARAGREPGEAAESICATCNGRGRVEANHKVDNSGRTVLAWECCDSCEGTGKEDKND